MQFLVRGAAHVIVAALCVIASSCSTLRVMPTKKLAQPVSAGPVVFVDVVMSDRVLPVFPLIDAAIYNSAVSANAASIAKVHEAKAESLNQQNAKMVEAIFGAPAKRVPNPFGKRTFEFEFYDRSSGVVRQKVRDLCTANGAEVAVASVLRVVSSAGPFGVSGCSYVDSVWYVFDKNGATIGKGDFRSETACAAPGDMASYGTLLDTSTGLSEQLLGLLK